MHYHNFPLYGKPASIYGSRVLVDVQTADLLGVGTLVTDDRGVGEELRKEFGLTIDGFLGGFMIKPELQGAGLGRCLWGTMDAEIQALVNGTGKPMEWFLFTANEIAAALYVASGFKLFQSQYPIKAFGGNLEDVYRKSYQPHSQS